MTMNRHESFEELISASLTEELTAAERQRLDTHLASCAQCTSTLAAFTDQRRIMAGVRHVAPPRDLGARVRTGIERGRFASTPWWRRPATIFAGVGGSLAAVAGALLAVVLLNGTPDDSQVGDNSPTPTASTAQEPSDAVTTLPPVQSPGPSAEPASAAPSSASPASVAPSPSVSPSPSVGPSASAAPAPTATPAEASPEPDVYLALTGQFDNLGLTLRQGPTGATITELETPSGPPIAAELSPDGQWLAYITQRGGSGNNEVRARRMAEGITSDDPEELPPIDSPIAVGETVLLGESVAGSPFLEQLFWSSNSAYLAYTLAAPADNSTDAWLFDVAFGEPRQYTDVGNAYAASWVPGGAGTSSLWISTAGNVPMSHLRSIHDSAGNPEDPRLGETGDPAEGAIESAAGVFQPLLSPNGSLAIYWNGRMERSGAEWLFAEVGAPYLAEHNEFQFTNERALFSDLTIGRDAFTSAAITWGTDGDAYAVWGTQWTGDSQDGDTPYPDAGRVYFGHATDPRGLTRGHAIDATDLPEGAGVVDVKVSPTGRHLVITTRRPIGGVQEAPRADLLLVERNTADVADEVSVLGSADDGWFGPAAFDDVP
ncbi:MAG: zf-HC2 domain-containing protein [Chloroflexota bacterium]|nr:zf-HC2 domain-containing protein [Chloroflexota bacterium]